MYIVYLIQSIEHPDKIYIGSTNDSERRLRQHNREILGGAKKTKKYMPWKYILHITGFNNRNDACKFEWILQHYKIGTAKKHLSTIIYNKYESRTIQRVKHICKCENKEYTIILN